MPTPPPTAANVARVRNFNRFYTRRIGVLHEGLLDSPFTLAESRLLWELAHREQPTATELASELDLNAGYMSRLLRRLKDRGLVRSTRSPNDGRHLHLALTAAGRRAFAPLDKRSQADVAGLIAGLTEHQQRQLLQAMTTLEQLLGAAPRQPPACVLRAPRPGDMGWVIARHAELYTSEYAWDHRFEAMVARIAADFIAQFDPQREAGWIAEREGDKLACVFLVQARDEATNAPRDGVAQLRMLLVDPAARGLGLGAQLVAQCERFARHAGYRQVVLWTNSLLTAARHLYLKAGYRLTDSVAHHSFGHDLVGETWSLDL